MSEQWHDDHRKAIAEKWTQCPPVTTKVKELIGDEVCMGTYGLVELEVMQLERELTDAQAEIENLHWRVSDEQAKTRAALELNSKALELVNEARAEIERKNAIIEQMRRGLKKHCDLCRCTFADICGNCETKAALEAAERPRRGNNE